MVKGLNIILCMECSKAPRLAGVAGGAPAPPGHPERVCGGAGRLCGPHAPQPQPGGGRLPALLPHAGMGHAATVCRHSPNECKQQKVGNATASVY